MTDEQVLDLYDTIHNFAAELDLRIEMREGRRQNDVAVLSVFGDPANTLSLYTRISKRFPEIELQPFYIPESEHYGTIASLVTAETLPAVAPKERRKFIGKRPSREKNQRELALA